MITIKTITPSEKELTPCLHVHVEVQDESLNRCHLSVSGLMFSSDGKLITIGQEIRDSDYSLSSAGEQQISSCDVNVTDSQTPNPEHFSTLLRFPIEPKAFDHIEKLRFEDQKRDVVLSFLFKIVFVEHNFHIRNGNTIILRNTNQSLGKANLFKINEYREKQTKRIPVGDWLNEYMGPLGFGKVILFEINQPSLDSITDFKSNDIDVPRFSQ